MRDALRDRTPRAFRRPTFALCGSGVRERGRYRLREAMVSITRAELVLNARSARAAAAPRPSGQQRCGAIDSRAAGVLPADSSRSSANVIQVHRTRGHLQTAGGEFRGWRATAVRGGARMVTANALMCTAGNTAARELPDRGDARG